MLLRLVPVDSLLASCLVVLVPLSRRFRYGLSYCFCHLQRFECETELPARLWGSYEITQQYLGRVVAALLCARLCLSVDRTPSAFLLLRERAVCHFRPRPRDVFSLWENSVNGNLASGDMVVSGLARAARPPALLLRASSEAKHWKPLPHSRACPLAATI